MKILYLCIELPEFCGAVPNLPKRSDKIGNRHQKRAAAAFAA